MCFPFCCHICLFLFLRIISCTNTSYFMFGVLLYETDELFYRINICMANIFLYPSGKLALEWIKYQQDIPTTDWNPLKSNGEH